MLHRATLFYKPKSDEDEDENSDWVFINRIKNV